MIVVHFIAFWLDKNTEYSHESEVKVSIDPNCGLYLRSMNLTETEREREKERSWTVQPQNFVHILEIFYFLSPQTLCSDYANTHSETHAVCVTLFSGPVIIICFLAGVGKSAQC